LARLPGRPVKEVLDEHEDHERHREDPEQEVGAEAEVELSHVWFLRRKV
jgi:hypothetical protein